MDPGTEILIDYGPAFFTKHEPQQSGTLVTPALSPGLSASTGHHVI